MLAQTTLSSSGFVDEALRRAGGRRESSWLRERLLLVFPNLVLQRIDAERTELWQAIRPVRADLVLPSPREEEILTEDCLARRGEDVGEMRCSRRHPILDPNSMKALDGVFALSLHSELSSAQTPRDTQSRLLGNAVSVVDGALAQDERTGLPGGTFSGFTGPLAEWRNSFVPTNTARTAMFGERTSGLRNTT